MGYGGPNNFTLVAERVPDVAAEGRRPRICELGDQTIHVCSETAKAILAFVDKRAAVDPALSSLELRRRLEAHLDQQMHVRDVWLAAGFDYVSIDVNEEGGARFVDLNYWPNEADALGTFDVVTNFGTTEHIANQASAFATVHHLLRPGGIAVHHIPIIHFLNHSLANVTPRFLLLLAAFNDYAVAVARAESHYIDRMVAFHYGTDILFLRGLRAALLDSTLATLAFVVLRKQSDAPFVPPVDVALDSPFARRLLARGLDHYNRRLAAGDANRAVDAALARAAAMACLDPIAGTIDRTEYDGRTAKAAPELNSQEPAIDWS